MKFKKKALKQAYLDGIRLGAKFSTRCEEPPTFKEWFKNLPKEECEHNFPMSTLSTWGNTCSKCGYMYMVNNIMQ
jgi:hypothetical protein